MKGLILLLSALAVLAVTHTAVVKAPSAARVSLTWGAIAVGDRLLSSRNMYQAPIANAMQSQDFVYRGNATNRITAIQAVENGMTQYGTPRIMAGGVGYNNATVRITSSRGYGFNYQISIWGR